MAEGIAAQEEALGHTNAAQRLRSTPAAEWVGKVGFAVKARIASRGKAGFVVKARIASDGEAGFAVKTRIASGEEAGFAVKARTASGEDGAGAEKCGSRRVRSRLS